MTLEEAIKHAEEKAGGCECGQEHAQLAKWLKELELYRASPASVPAGYVLVPVVPTHAILDAMFDAGIARHDVDLTILYRAILAATPTPPSTGDQREIVALRKQVEKLTKERDEAVAGFEAAASKYRNLKLQLQEVINVR